MVQYVITPWRDHEELLAVRAAFYATPETASTEDKRHSIDIVSVWVQRGNCPQLVEATAILISATVNDEPQASAYALRPVSRISELFLHHLESQSSLSAYNPSTSKSLTTSRFVTGLLDGYQDKRHKLSMYSIAKNVDLPATFVELRHQCTHEELPSLQRLRAAAARSLSWIWKHYWAGVGGSLQVSDAGESNDLSTVLREVVEWNRSGDQASAADRSQRVRFQQRLNKFEPGELLETLQGLVEQYRGDSGFVLECFRIEGAILSHGKDFLAELRPKDNVQTTAPSTEKRSLQQLREELERFKGEMEIVEDEEESELKAGPNDEAINQIEEEEALETEIVAWTRWKGPWLPRPIGVV